MIFRERKATACVIGVGGGCLSVRTRWTRQLVYDVTPFDDIMGYA